MYKINLFSGIYHNETLYMRCRQLHERVGIASWMYLVVYKRVIFYMFKAAPIFAKSFLC